MDGGVEEEDWGTCGGPSTLISNGSRVLVKVHLRIFEEEETSFSAIPDLDVLEEEDSEQEERPC